ncbi:MAG: hypothetical protein R3F59_15940 [Myxococcota bacterium]
MRDFCLGETPAVPLFRAMQARAAHPAVAPVLRRILADEAVHRAFGWEALDWLLEAQGRRGAGPRRRLARPAGSRHCATPTPSPAACPRRR